MECIEIGCGNEKSGRFLRCNPCRNGRLRYGLSSVEQKIMLKKQNDKCILCLRDISFNGKTAKNSAVVDHNHETGHVRGILCAPCNGLIGTIENRIGICKLDNYLSVA